MRSSDVAETVSFELKERYGVLRTVIVIKPSRRGRIMHGVADLVSFASLQLHPF